jgi:hypothetical protein
MPRISLSFTEKTVIKRLLSVIPLKLVLSRVEASVYTKEGNHDFGVAIYDVYKNGNFYSSSSKANC